MSHHFHLRVQVTPVSPVGPYNTLLSSGISATIPAFLPHQQSVFHTAGRVLYTESKSAMSPSTHNHPMAFTTLWTKSPPWQTSWDWHEVVSSFLTLLSLCCGHSGFLWLSHLRESLVPHHSPSPEKATYFLRCPCSWRHLFSVMTTVGLAMGEGVAVTPGAKYPTRWKGE